MGGYLDETAGAAVDYLKSASQKPLATAQATPGVPLDRARAFLAGDSMAAQALKTNYPGVGLGGGVAPAPAAVPAADPAAGAAPGNPYDSTFGTVQPGMGGAGGFQLTPPRLIKSHFDDSRIPLRPGTQQQLYNALDNQRTVDAGQNLAQVQANAAIASANILEAEAERAKGAMADRQSREAERQYYVRKQLDTAKKLNEEANKATVDPSKFWSSPGAMLMSIGAILSTNGEGTRSLERAQEMELANQREQIAIKKQRGLDAENTLAKYQKAFGDERAAELAWEADSRDIARMKLMALAERSQSPQILAHANLMASGLAEQRDLKRAEFNARMDQLSYVPAQVIGGGMGGAKPMDNIVALPNGMQLKLATKELHNEAVGKIAATEMLKRNNDRAIKLRGEYVKALKSGHVLDADRIKGELVALQSSSINMRSIAQGQGVVKEAEFERAKKDFPYTDINPRAEDAIRNNTSLAVQDLSMWFGANRAERVATGYTQGARGVEPAASFVGQATSPASLDAQPSSFQLQQPQVGKR
jgi:hypothetical protein